MAHTRRGFLKLAGAATVAAAAVPHGGGAAQTPAPGKRSGNGGQMPKGLTLCTLRSGDRFTLGVRTKKGVLDVEKAAKALRKTSPTTMDDLLQGGDGKALQALVEAATANGNAKGAFVAEERAPFAPLGPWLVTADQIPDPQTLKLECSVNGEVRQSANTNDMIFSVANIVSYASQHFTLKPGDIFFTGTPSGVIYGMPPEKQVWLKPGDKVACSIDKCGELRFSLAGSQA